MLPLTGQLCSICGERLASPLISPSMISSGVASRGLALVDEDAPLCGLCRRATPPYAKASAYGSYEGGLRELIHLMKYERVHPAARVLGRMLAEAIADLESFFKDDKVLMVPVPLHKRKQRQRGYNQSELIARAALKNVPAPARFELDTRLLERRRETQSQIGLSSHQRRENMRGAFAVPVAAKVAGREILLVDDVFTTGTTVAECARVLRRAGASRVYVATVARTLKFETRQVELKPAAEAAFTMAAAG